MFAVLAPSVVGRSAGQVAQHVVGGAGDLGAGPVGPDTEDLRSLRIRSLLVTSTSQTGTFNCASASVTASR